MQNSIKTHKPKSVGFFTSLRFCLRNRLALPVVSLALLGGCTASDIAETFFDPDGYKLVSFDVFGTSEDLQNPSNGLIQAPINPAINSGNFFVHWTTLDEKQTYHVTLYVSENSQLSERTDIEFYDDNCSSSTDCSRDSSSNLDCYIDTNNRIQCGNDATDTDITDVLISGNVMTEGAYIIIQTCNATRFSCGTDSHPVIFQ
jgi:hypothetical protein